VYVCICVCVYVRVYVRVRVCVTTDLLSRLQQQPGSTWHKGGWLGSCCVLCRTWPLLTAAVQLRHVGAPVEH